MAGDASAAGFFCEAIVFGFETVENLVGVKTLRIIRYGFQPAFAYFGQALIAQFALVVAVGECVA